MKSGRFSRMVTRFRQWKCDHAFDLVELAKTGESEDGDRRVKWPCAKCGKVFFAHCGLDISPKHGYVLPKSEKQTVDKQ